MTSQVTNNNTVINNKSVLLLLYESYHRYDTIMKKNFRYDINYIISKSANEKIHRIYNCTIFFSQGLHCFLLNCVGWKETFYTILSLAIFMYTQMTTLIRCDSIDLEGQLRCFTRLVAQLKKDYEVKLYSYHTIIIKNIRLIIRSSKIFSSYPVMRIISICRLSDMLWVVLDVDNYLIIRTYLVSLLSYFYRTFHQTSSGEESSPFYPPMQ